MTTTYAIKANQPVSEKQAGLLRRLDPVHAEDALATLDRRAVSALISHLLANPQQQTGAPKPPRREGAPEVTPGYYQDSSEDVFVVVLNKDKTRTYAKRLEFRTGADGSQRASWAYVPGAVYQLEGLKPLTIEEAARLGHLHGICVICAKQLTDPKSVEQGIGPVCITRLAG